MNPGEEILAVVCPQCGGLVITTGQKVCHCDHPAAISETDAILKKSEQSIATTVKKITQIIAQGPST